MLRHSIIEYFLTSEHTSKTIIGQDKAKAFRIGAKYGTLRKYLLVIHTLKEVSSYDGNM